MRRALAMAAVAVAFIPAAPARRRRRGRRPCRRTPRRPVAGRTAGSRRLRRRRLRAHRARRGRAASRPTCASAAGRARRRRRRRDWAATGAGPRGTDLARSLLAAHAAGIDPALISAERNFIADTLALWDGRRLVRPGRGVVALRRHLRHARAGGGGRPAAAARRARDVPALAADRDRRLELHRGRDVGLAGHDRSRRRRAVRGGRPGHGPRRGQGAHAPARPPGCEYRGLGRELRHRRLGGQRAADVRDRPEDVDPQRPRPAGRPHGPAVAVRRVPLARRGHDRERAGDAGLDPAARRRGVHRRPAARAGGGRASSTRRWWPTARSCPSASWSTTASPCGRARSRRARASRCRLSSTPRSPRAA